MTCLAWLDGVVHRRGRRPSPHYLEALSYAMTFHIISARPGTAQPTGAPWWKPSLGSPPVDCGTNSCNGDITTRKRVPRRLRLLRESRQRCAGVHESHRPVQDAPRCAGRAVVLRIEPRTCGPCLDPAGLPSLARSSPPLRGVTIGPAVPAVITKAARPVAGDRVLAEGRQGVSSFSVQ